jgi:hypothetical protein
LIIIYSASDIGDVSELCGDVRPAGWNDDINSNVIQIENDSLPLVF